MPNHHYEADQRDMATDIPARDLADVAPSQATRTAIPTRESGSPELQEPWKR